MDDYDNLDLETTVEDASDEEILKFLHLLGEKIFSGKHPDFLHEEKYKLWKAKFLPKNIPAEITAALNDWNNTVSEWLDAIMPEVLKKSLLVILDAFGYEDVSADELVKDIENNHSNELQELKAKILAKIKKKDFLMEEFTKLDDIDKFIKDYLSLCYIDYSGDEKRIFSTDSVAIPDDDEEPFVITKEDFIGLDSELGQILQIELLYRLRNNPVKKILNNDETITRQLRDEPDARLISILDVEPFKPFKKELMLTICKHKGDYYHAAIPNNLWENVKTRQKELIAARMNRLVEDIVTGQPEGCLSPEIIRELIRLTKIPFENLNIDEEVFRKISRTTKHLIYSAFNRTDGSKSDFLYVYLGLDSEDDETLTECFAKTGEFLRDALKEKRDEQFKQTIRTLPCEPIDTNYTKPQGYYVTKFPHNYSFPQITNQEELFVAIKLAYRSLVRLHKTNNSRATFFYPAVSIKTINKHPAAQEIQTTTAGDKHCYHFPLQYIGRTTIVFNLSEYGVVNPFVQAFGTYTEARDRLANFKKSIRSQIPDISDSHFAKWMMQIAALHGDEVRAAGIAADQIEELMQFLGDFTMTLLYVETLRNKGCFTTHGLTLKRIADGDLTFKQALPNEFPAGPKKSTKAGRIAHAQITNAQNTILGPDARQQKKANIRAAEVVAIKAREVAAVRHFGDETQTSVATKISSFSAVIQRPPPPPAAKAPAQPKQHGVGKAPSLRRR